MGFPSEEYWGGLPFPSSGHLPDPVIESMSPELAGRFFFFFTTEPPGKPSHILNIHPCRWGPEVYIFGSVCWFVFSTAAVILRGVKLETYRNNTGDQGTRLKSSRNLDAPEEN